MSEIYKALFKLQGLIRGVQKDAKNPHFKNTYATLEQVTDTIRPHMQACGLVWADRVKDGSIEVTTTIAHAESGEAITGTMEVPLGKKDPQGAGSSVTYGLRYSLMAALGLPPTDDDAETAIDRNNERQQPVDHRQQAPAPKPHNYDAMLSDLRRCSSQDDVTRWWKDEDVKAVRAKWPEEWALSLKDECAKHGRSLKASDTVEDIKKQFGGTVVNEHVKEEAE